MNEIPDANQIPGASNTAPDANQAPSLNQTPGANDAALVKQTTSEERTWAMLCHLSVFVHVIPLSPITGPLIIWLLKKEEFPLVDDQGKESLNFQITMIIAFIISALLIFAIIGFVLLPTLAIFYLIVVIIGAIKAYNGEKYRYPLTIRFIK